MKDVLITGVGMTRFGKFPDRSIKDLGREAVELALDDAGCKPKDIELAVVGSAVSGLISGQEMIRGQLILREAGIGNIPIFNVENACASSSSAFHLAVQMVDAGQADSVLVLGVDKLFARDRSRSFAALRSAVDIEEVDALVKGLGGGEGNEENRSVFVDTYAARARKYMTKYGATAEHFAKIASKNHRNGSLNSFAQYQHPYTSDEVLASRLVVDPLTVLMCAPIGDGAAALVVTSKRKARNLTRKPISVAASVVLCGHERSQGEIYITERVAKKAYDEAGVGPAEINVAEVHDAAAPAELIAYEQLGFCGPGEGVSLIENGDTEIGGRIPVNTSGGLIARGHPVGPTGAAQLCELVWQLRNEANDRQVSGARVGLAQNNGGHIGSAEFGESAVSVIHILTC